MVAPEHNIDPKILPEESAKLRWAGREAGDLIFQPLWSNGKKKAIDVGGPSSIDFIVERLWCQRPIQCTVLYICKYFVYFIYFWRSNKKQRRCDGRGGARSAPFAMLMRPKRRVRAAHGRARAAKTH